MVLFFGVSWRLLLIRLESTKLRNIHSAWVLILFGGCNARVKEHRPLLSGYIRQE